jgi:hypothetical protein
VVITAGTTEPGGGASSPSLSPIFARATDGEQPVPRPQLVLTVGEQAATRIGTAAAESGRTKLGKAAAAMEDAHAQGRAQSGDVQPREVRDRGLGLRAASCM